jgi:hypothetical protein
VTAGLQEDALRRLLLNADLEGLSGIFNIETAGIARL